MNLTERQKLAFNLAKSPARFILYRGGSRSGKSFLICYLIFIRALSTPGSRHGVFRQTAVDVRATLFDLTFRQVMEAHTPGLWDSLKQSGKISDSEMTIELPNGSLITFSGLDDSTRQDRILGQEYTTIFVNEVSQFKTFEIIQKLISRLSENKMTMRGTKMAPKLFLDCNPTSKRHWTYRGWIEKVNPISLEPWPRPDEWAEMAMNAIDNAANISETYLDDLQNLSARDRKRFLEGEWQAENDNAMFLPEWWAGDGRHRRLKPYQPIDTVGFRRIVVSVDPAGSSRPGSDETGIIVAGIDYDGHCYVLEDRSGRYQPHEWASVAIEAYERWKAAYIVTEDNFGKEMVPNTIRMLNTFVPVKCVSAMRGKVIRAQPVAALYEQGLVHHCGTFDKLEAQLEEFHLDWNRTKDGSPDRLDALVWAITDLAVVLLPPTGSLHRKSIPGFWR